MASVVDSRDSAALRAAFAAIASARAELTGRSNELTKQALVQRLRDVLEREPTLEAVKLQQRTSEYDDEGPTDWELTLGTITVDGVEYGVSEWNREGYGEDAAVNPAGSDAETEVGRIAALIEDAIAPFPDDAVPTWLDTDDVELIVTRTGIDAHYWEHYN